MKTKYWLYTLIVGMCGIFAQCKKSKTPVQTKSYKIYNKTLAEIREEIKGDWIVHSFCGCGCCGCSCDTRPNSTMSFRTNDTLKWINAGSLFRYGKMNVRKSDASNYSISDVDSVYAFEIPNDIYTYVIREIKNDTLTINTAFLNGSFFLTR